MTFHNEARDEGAAYLATENDMTRVQAEINNDARGGASMVPESLRRELNDDAGKASLDKAKQAAYNAEATNLQNAMAAQTAAGTTTAAAPPAPSTSTPATTPPPAAAAAPTPNPSVPATTGSQPLAISTAPSTDTGGASVSTEPTPASIGIAAAPGRPGLGMDPGTTLASYAGSHRDSTSGALVETETATGSTSVQNVISAAGENSAEFLADNNEYRAGGTVDAGHTFEIRADDVAGYKANISFPSSSTYDGGAAVEANASTPSPDGGAPVGPTEPDPVARAIANEKQNHAVEDRHKR
jgi:hypothetical protein